MAAMRRRKAHPGKLSNHLCRNEYHFPRPQAGVDYRNVRLGECEPMKNVYSVTRLKRLSEGRRALSPFGIRDYGQYDYRCMANNFSPREMRNSYEAVHPFKRSTPAKVHFVDDHPFTPHSPHRLNGVNVNHRNRGWYVLNGTTKSNLKACKPLYDTFGSAEEAGDARIGSKYYTPRRSKVIFTEPETVMVHSDADCMGGLYPERRAGPGAVVDEEETIGDMKRVGSNDLAKNFYRPINSGHALGAQLAGRLNDFLVTLGDFVRNVENEEHNAFTVNGRKPIRTKVEKQVLKICREITDRLCIELLIAKETLAQSYLRPKATRGYEDESKKLYRELIELKKQLNEIRKKYYYSMKRFNSINLRKIH